MSRWNNRSILATTGLVALSLLVSLLAAEALVRLVRPQPRLVITPGGLYVPDPPGRYRLTPGYRGRIYNRAEYDNEIRINGAGLRGPELEPCAQGVMRVLALGDSFTFGVGVDDSETFVASLADQLTEGGHPAQSLNAGIPAFGVPDAESWFRRHGTSLEPDVVILAIFLGNDLVDASPDREEVLIVDGLLVPGKSPRGLKAWLHRHSHLFAAVKNLLEQPGFRPLRERLGLGEPWKVRTLREEFGVYKTTAEGELGPAIEVTDVALGRLVAQAEQQEFHLLALLIPSEIQLDPDRWQQSLASLDLDPGDYDPETPTRIFHALLDKHAIPTVDMGPLVGPRLAAGDKLYFRLDRHWTPSAHALAATELMRALLPLIIEEAKEEEGAIKSGSGE